MGIIYQNYLECKWLESSPTYLSRRGFIDFTTEKYKGKTQSRLVLSGSLNILTVPRFCQHYLTLLWVVQSQIIVSRKLSNSSLQLPSSSPWGRVQYSLPSISAIGFAFYSLCLNCMRVAEPIFSWENVMLWLWFTWSQVWSKGFRIRGETSKRQL